MNRFERRVALAKPGNAITPQALWSRQPRLTMAWGRSPASQRRSTESIVIVTISSLPKRNRLFRLPEIFQ